MANETHKELSGSFSSAEKWSAVLNSLTSAECPIQHLHVLHNKGPHNILVAAALYSNTSVSHVEWGDLDRVGAACLSQVLSRNTHIKQLKIHRLTNPEATVAELVPGLRNSCSIEVLDMLWAGQECLLAAAAAVRSPCSALRRIEISRSVITPDLVACFTKAYMLGSGALKELCIRDCTHLGDALQQLLHGLESCSNVEDLQLTSCGVVPSTLQALSACPKLCQGLQHLSLTGNGVSSSGVQWLAQAFPECCSLVKINLEMTGLDDRCAKDLAALVNKSPKLETLLLAENELGDAALEDLAIAVSTHHNLRDLDLSKNKFSGIKSIGLLTCGSSPLEILKLMKNWRIGDEGVTSIAEAMMDNTHLTHLYLSESGCKCDGAKALADAVRVHPALSSLHLDGCRIGDAGATALMDAIRANLNMRYWNMDNNRMRDKMTKKMILDFCTAVSKRTDESMLKRKSLKVQHATQHSPSSVRSPPSTPSHNSPRQQHTNHSEPTPAPQPIAFLTPLQDKSTAPEAAVKQPGSEAPNLGSRGGRSTETLFPNIKNLWKGANISLSSSENMDDNKEEAGAGKFSSFSARKTDSFGHWVSGSKGLTSVDSLTSWGGFMLQPARSWAASILSKSRPQAHEEEMEDGHEDANMGEADDADVQFQSDAKDEDEVESPRFIGAFGSITQTFSNMGSFKFFNFIRSSSESASTPRVGNCSPLSSPTLSTNTSRLPASRLAEVSE